MYFFIKKVLHLDLNGVKLINVAEITAKNKLNKYFKKRVDNVDETVLRYKSSFGKRNNLKNFRKKLLTTLGRSVMI